MKKFLHSKFVSEYGTLLVLLVLFAYYTVATWGVVHPVGDSAAREVSEKIIDQKNFEHLFRCQMIQRFQKSYLEQRAISLKIRFRFFCKKESFFPSI